MGTFASASAIAVRISSGVMNHSFSLSSPSTRCCRNAPADPKSSGMSPRSTIRGRTACASTERSTARFARLDRGITSAWLTTVVQKSRHASAAAWSRIGGLANATTLSASGGLFSSAGRLARSRIPTRAATPAPRECPVMTTLKPAGRRRSSTSAVRSLARRFEAVRMPSWQRISVGEDGANGPGRISVTATPQQSVRRSSREDVPLTATIASFCFWSSAT
mmetsp:Transcript_19881/g.49363  ORF Transcript_19881/g.49363 Transcript_19881/m.49363 type:complete len:221 (-) Transcript_19881:1257-1919(-)